MNGEPKTKSLTFYKFLETVLCQQAELVDSEVRQGMDDMTNYYGGVMDAVADACEVLSLEAPTLAKRYQGNISNAKQKPEEEFAR